MGQPSLPANAPPLTYAIYSWKWKADAPLQDIERAFDEMCAMGDDVPGIRRASWGRNEADAGHAQGHTHVMIVIADSEAAINEYNSRTSKHPMVDTVHGAEESGVGLLINQPT